MEYRTQKKVAKWNFDNYHSELGFNERFIIHLWKLIWLLFLRLVPGKLGRRLHVLALRIFGAKCEKGSEVYQNAFVTYPPGLELGVNSTLGPGVVCDSIGSIKIGNNTVISQYCYMVSVSHDYTRESFDLVRRSIIIGDNVWLTAHCKVAPGTYVSDYQVFPMGSVLKGKL